MDGKHAIAEAAQEIMDQLDATLRALLATSIPNDTKLAVGQHISYATLSLEGFIEQLQDPLDPKPDEISSGP